MTKQVLHLLNLDTLGGVEELFVHFLEHAQNQKVAQHHLLNTGNQPHPFFRKKLSAAASTTHEKHLFGIKLPRLFRSLQQRAACKKSRPDTVLLWNRIVPLNEIKKTAPNAHIIYYEHGASWISSQTKDMRLFFDSVDALITISHAAKRMLELKWGIQRPITVVHNPLKPQTSMPAVARKAPDSTKRPFVIGYVGRLIALKGVHLLLHAVAELSRRAIPVSLQIAGTGPCKESLERLAHTLGIQHLCHFLGCVENVWQLYDSIDVLVIPSIREPLGLVAQEAQIRGCPVIASDVDGLPEVVADGKTGFTIRPTIECRLYKEFGCDKAELPDLVYDPTTDQLLPAKLVNPHDLAEKLALLATNPTLYEACSRQAIEHAHKRPTFTHYVGELLSVI